VNNPIGAALESLDQHRGYMEILIAKIELYYPSLATCKVLEPLNNRIATVVPRLPKVFAQQRNLSIGSNEPRKILVLYLSTVGQSTKEPEHLSLFGCSREQPIGFP
jgi:hypothetical protein